MYCVMVSTLGYLRSYRLFDIALFDVFGTALGGLLISKKLNLSFLITFIILMVIGVIVHWVLEVPTMLNYYLGINSKESVIKAREN